MPNNLKRLTSSVLTTGGIALWASNCVIRAMNNDKKQYFSFAHSSTLHSILFISMFPTLLTS